MTAIANTDFDRCDDCFHFTGTVREVAAHANSTHNPRSYRAYVVLSDADCDGWSHSRVFFRTQAQAIAYAELVRREGYSYSAVTVYGVYDERLLCL